MANSRKFPKDPPAVEDGTIYLEDILKQWFSGATLPPRVMKDQTTDLAETLTKIHKAGMRLPMSWEALAGETRRGVYVPTGNKFIQRIEWAYGLVLYKTWRWLEKRLDNNRHFYGVSGYEWEDAEYRDFEQKTKWVETEIQEDEDA